jgi:hypothetical protein
MGQMINERRQLFSLLSPTCVSYVTRIADGKCYITTLNYLCKLDISCVKSDCITLLPTILTLYCNLNSSFFQVCVCEGAQLISTMTFAFHVRRLMYGFLLLGCVYITFQIVRLQRGGSYFDDVDRSSRL